MGTSLKEQNLLPVSLIVLEILKKNLILTSNKGHNYVANLWRMTVYNLRLDLIYEGCNCKRYCKRVDTNGCDCDGKCPCRH